MKMIRLVLLMGLLGFLSLEAQGPRSGTGLGVILGRTRGGASLKHWVAAGPPPSMPPRPGPCRAAIRCNCTRITCSTTSKSCAGTCPIRPPCTTAWGPGCNSTEDRSGRHHHDNDNDDDGDTAVGMRSRWA